MHIELPWMTKGLFVLGTSLREHPLLYISGHVVLLEYSYMLLNNLQLDIDLIDGYGSWLNIIHF